VRQEELPEDLADERLAPGRKGGIGRTFELWKTDSIPPVLDPTAPVAAVDIRCQPGETIWRLWIVPPGERSSMHRTETISYSAVVSGGIDVVLDDGTEPLESGDLLVCLGVTHGWEASVEGATLLTTVIGVASGRAG